MQGRGQRQSLSLTGQEDMFAWSWKYLSNQCKECSEKKTGSLESYVRKSFYSYRFRFKNHAEQALADYIFYPTVVFIRQFQIQRCVVHLGVLFVLFCLLAEQKKWRKEPVSLGIPNAILYSNICICKNDFLTITSVHDNICFLEKSLLLLFPTWYSWHLINED